MLDFAKLVLTPVTTRSGQQVNRWKKPSPKVKLRIPFHTKKSDSDNAKELLLEQKVSISKCSHPDHFEHGCSSLHCEQGMGRDAAKNTILANPDYIHEIRKQGITNIDWTTLNGYKIDHWIAWVIRDADDPEHVALIHLPPHRPEVVEHVKAIDKSIVPSFATMTELASFVQELYPPHIVNFTMTNTKHVENDDKPVIEIMNLFVDADLRGIGVGRHIMEMATQFADEHELVLVLSPVENGDGSLPRNAPYSEWNEQRVWENRKGHYERITSFYSSYGFEPNPFHQESFIDQSMKPYVEYDAETAKALSRQAINAVQFNSYIRYPNKTSQLPDYLLDDRD